VENEIQNPKSKILKIRAVLKSRWGGKEKAQKVYHARGRPLVKPTV